VEKVQIEGVRLAEFCDRESQCRAAELMGITPGAVWQMIRAGREIYISLERGEVVEVRRRQCRS
jgi:predicted DNA-binding protein (UPF0251 family)